MRAKQCHVHCCEDTFFARVVFHTYPSYVRYNILPHDSHIESLGCLHVSPSASTPA